MAKARQRRQEDEAAARPMVRRRRMARANGSEQWLLDDVKDFTTVLTLHRDKRGEILAQLREIYDGHYRKEFGNGKVVDWTGKIGLIAGVTPIIDTYHAVNQVLGERFVCFRIKSESGAAVA